MAFLNVLLLGGTAAGVIPLAIHLLHRKNPKIVRWGAMQFLLSRTASQNRRHKIEQWFLLLLRMSIPILLALCMARPVLQNYKATHPTTPESLILLMDDSASMGLATANNTPIIAAKQAAQFYLKHLPRGSEVTILFLANPDLPLVELSVDTKGASKLLETIQSRPTHAKLAEGLNVSADLLARAHHARRRIVLMSDFQKSNWSEDRLNSCRQALARLRSQIPQPSITLFDAGTPKPENVAIESIDFSKLPAGPGQKINFTATLRNHGSLSEARRTLAWKIDGAPVSSKTLSIKPQESIQSSFEQSFKETGIHTVEAALEADEHPMDDVFFASVEVHEPINVLIVNGHPSSESMRGETDFLELALQPRVQSSAKTANGLIHTTTVDPNGLNAKTLAKNKTVILADVKSLTKQQVQDLEAFILAGGGLVFFPGRQTDVEWSNNVLHAEGRGILPARIEALQNNFSGKTQPSVGIAKPTAHHPVTQIFTRDAGALDEVAIENWYSLKTHASDRPGHASSPAVTVMSLDNGEPLFVERPYGNGVVIQSAVPCGAHWTNLPTRPVFVPLMQRLTLQGSMATKAPLNLIAGTPLLASYDPRLSNQPAFLTSPDGTTTQCLPTRDGNHALAEFFGTYRTGLYFVNTPDGETRQYAVNASREESDPARHEGKELEAIAHQMQAKLAHSSEAHRLIDPSESEGQEIWQMLLWVVAALLFLELFYTQRLSHVPRPQP